MKNQYFVEMTDLRGLTMRFDDLILWFLLCLTVALFASLQYDPCNVYADGSEAFINCEVKGE